MKQGTGQSGAGTKGYLPKGARRHIHDRGALPRVYRVAKVEKKHALRC